MPFRPLFLSWTGRGDAAQLAGAEPDGEALPLAQKHLMSAFYLNELIISLTTRHDPQTQLFDDYARALRRLSTDAQPEPALRVFEKRLLESIGYGLELDVAADCHYQFAPSQGLYEVREDAAGAYSGRTLLALREESLDDRADAGRGAPRPPSGTRSLSRRSRASYAQRRAFDGAAR